MPQLLEATQGRGARMLEPQPQAVLQGVLTAGLSGNLLFAETDNAVLEVHTESVHDCLFFDRS